MTMRRPVQTPAQRAKLRKLTALAELARDVHEAMIKRDRAIAALVAEGVSLDELGAVTGLGLPGVQRVAERMQRDYTRTAIAMSRAMNVSKVTPKQVAPGV